jgi:hypothetical protein
MIKQVKVKLKKISSSNKPPLKSVSYKILNY